MQMMNSEVLVGSVEHVSIVAVKVQGGSGRFMESHGGRYGERDPGSIQAG